MDETTIVLLMVPELSNAGEAGVTTEGSKSIFKSYEITFKPFKLPTVIGMTTTPVASTTFGSDTGTVTPAGAVNPFGSESETGALFKEALEAACSKPKNSFTESINGKPDALAVTTSENEITRAKIAVRRNVEFDAGLQFDINLYYLGHRLHALWFNKIADKDRLL